MKARKFLVLISLCFGWLLISNSTSFAATNTSASHESFSQTEVNVMDKYILVENNRFIISKEAQEALTSVELSSLESIISNTNKQVAEKNLCIDPQTKEIYEPQSFSVFAAYNRNFTTGRFWWGKRYYFTSNEAVRRGKNYFYGIGNSCYNISLFFSAVSDSIGGVIKWATLGANIISMGVSAVANRYYGAGNYLVAYNNRHLRNQIYLDFNFHFNYSCGILA